MDSILLDDVDKKILEILNTDGRAAYSLIATTLGVSNTMVHQRIGKLMEQGLIQQFQPVLNEKKLGFGWGSFTGISLERDHDSQKVIEALKEIPEITECYYVSGSFTLFLRIVARDHEHLRKLLYEQLDNIEGIQKTDSMIDLGCAFKRNVHVG